MIVYKFWTKEHGRVIKTVEIWEGWFLLGFIPLYIRKVSEKRR